MRQTLSSVSFTTQKSKQFQNNVFIGNQFAFITGTELSDDKLDYLDLASTCDVRVIPLDKHRSIEICGIKIRSEEIAPLTLNSISSEKRIYQPNEDIELFVIATGARNQRIELEIIESSETVDTHEVEVNSFGAGHSTLTGLACGEYEVRFTADTEGKFACKIQVAEFRLATLVAELIDFQIVEYPRKRPATFASLKLTAMGNSINGSAKLDLLENGKLLVSKIAEVKDGLVEIKFPFSGCGALSIDIQMQDEASQTASLYLQGTKAEDRKPVVFSTLGPVIEGSVVPAGDELPVRGLYLEESWLQSEPVQVRQNGNSIDVEFIADVDDFCVKKFSLLQGDGQGETNVDRFGNLIASEKINLDCNASVSLICFAGFVDKKPWEGCCVIVTHATITAEIELPEKPCPGEKFNLSVRSNTAKMAYVVVRDLRLAQGDCPAVSIASQIKNKVGELKWMIDSDNSPFPASFFSSPVNYLLLDNVFGEEQLQDAERYARRMSVSTETALITLGYATEREVFSAIARWIDTPFVDLGNASISEYVVELMPESVARENIVLPLGVENGRLVVATADPQDIDTIEKLRFILNRDIAIRVATKTNIIELINRIYGQIPGESADSILQEFTDTAIDFTSMCDLPSSSLKRTQLTNLPAKPLKSKTKKLVQEYDGKILLSTMARIENGTAAIELDLPDGNRDYIVDLFVYNDDDGFDWNHNQIRFRAERNPFAEFDLPLFLNRNDGTTGHIHFGTESGRANIDISTPAENFSYQDVHVSDVDGKVSFLATFGDYRVSIEDLENGQSTTVIATVKDPGAIERLTKPILLVESGKTISIDQEFLRIEPVTIDTSLTTMIESTSNYQHCCCEQTAAKIASSVHAYLLHMGQHDHLIASDRMAIIAGIERMQSMFKKGLGFQIYPDNQQVIPRWSSIAGSHLRTLQLLDELDIPDVKLQLAIECGISMSNEVESGAEFNSAMRTANAYQTIRFSREDQEKVKSLEWLTEFVASKDFAINNSVANRFDKAYASAAFFASKKTSLVRQGLLLAREVLADVNEAGNLYSTLDSAAAISMLAEMKIANVISSCNMKINGNLSSKLSRRETVTEITAGDSATLVQATKRVQVPWDSFSNNVRMRVKLRSKGRNISVGENCELLVELIESYMFGDVLNVCLPPCLSRLYGGGQVKKFSVDFEGKEKLSVPLVVTGTTLNCDGKPAPHHFAITVTNMYDEDRFGCPGWLKLMVS